VPFEVLFWIATTLFAVTLASEGFFDPLFFAGFQVEGVAFDFLDNVFLLHFAFKATQSIFKSLAVLHDNFCHKIFTSSLVGIALFAQRKPLL